ncbi:GGDEF domain-containing protein [Thiolapillus sp.]
MDNDADVVGLDRRIRHKQFILLVGHLPVVLPTSLLVAGLVGWGFWHQVDQRTLLIWLGALFLLTVGRILLSWRFMRQPEDISRDHRLKWFLLAGAFMSGTLWGMAGFLFFDPGNPYGFAFLTIVLGGMLSGALGSHSYYFPCFLAFALPDFLPLIWVFSVQKGEMYELITLAMLLFLALSVYYSKKQEDLIMASIRLQFANDSLLQELRTANRELHQHSYTDPLTGIGNRRQFDLDMEQTWQVAQTTGARVCLILMDVDHFKEYNDRYGHPRGDSVLKDIARVMLEVCEKCKARGRPMRIGGEEFSLLLKGDLEAAKSIAESMRQAIASLYPAEDDLRITASFGVAMANPSEGDTRKKLFQSADRALYEAKTGGRNRMVVFDGQDPANQS